MPLASIHLINLKPTVTVPAFLKALSSSSFKPLVVSKVIRWVILPEKIDATELLAHPWDLLLVSLDTSPLPSSLTTHIAHTYSTKAGVPSRLTNNFSQTNDSLLHPSSTLPLTGALNKPQMGSSSQTLEMSNSLSKWVNQFSQTREGKGAMSMLNFLAFNEGKHEDYLIYGKAFAESIGKKRGGNAKIVGNIVDKKDGGWDEMALAHYPSILHFADMLSSKDYQEVNLKHRVGSLRDTCILCTSEIAIEDIIGSEGGKAKL